MTDDDDRIIRGKSKLTAVVNKAADWVGETPWVAPFVIGVLLGFVGGILL